MLLARADHFKKIPKLLKQIEEKWKPVLDSHFEMTKNIIDSTNGEKPRYILSMFPYPSGNLHLGHVRIYTSSDLISRFSRLKCNGTHTGNVINPMGFDSYGLPAENAARERGIDPATWIRSNISTMKKQMNDLAFQFDWRESTSDAQFYKWTQQLFTRLMRSNLVYKTYAQVNWDPVDKTVLADEQVDEDGRSWRSGAKIEKRNYHQWFVKTNAFCNDIYLAENVNRDYWHDIIDIQRNWIGKPCGWMFYLPIECNWRMSDSVSISVKNVLLIFTDRPELLDEKETSLVISDDHWLASFENVNSGIVNPFNGELMKVVVLNNEKDKALLPISTKATITLANSDLIRESENLKTISDKRDRILRFANKRNYGGYFTSDRYRDWLISRQRYWGTPIPVVHCPECHHQPVKDSDLPVQLPHIGNLRLLEREKKSSPSSSSITSPLRDFGPRHWLETKCPNCGSKAVRETDTCDTLFDSSWYYLRYATEPLLDKAFDKERVQPVWCYVGGKEHAAMHLFYARFVTHFLHSQKLLTFKEPFERLLVQGVVKSKTYRLGGRYLSSSDVQQMKQAGHPDLSKVTEEYEKMSKSKGNGIDPMGLLQEFGIDATRFCLLSYVNPDTERLWRTNEEEFKDILIFFRRIALSFDELYNLKTCREREHEPVEEKTLRDLRYARNKNVWSCTYHLQCTYKFRQYISSLHSFFNLIKKHTSSKVGLTEDFSQALESFIVLLNPLVPHLSEELWSIFKQYRRENFQAHNEDYTASLACQQPWPKLDLDFPLSIVITSNKNRKSMDTIKIDQQKFRKLSKYDVAKLAHDHLSSKGHEFNILEVEVGDLLSRVVVNIKEDQAPKKTRIKNGNKSED